MTDDEIIKLINKLNEEQPIFKIMIKRLLCYFESAKSQNFLSFWRWNGGKEPSKELENNGKRLNELKDVLQGYVDKLASELAKIDYLTLEGMLSTDKKKVLYLQELALYVEEIREVLKDYV